jgi:ribosomal protein S18 acetylase RimI-like enzyme
VDEVVVVEEVVGVDEELVDAFARLVPQLSSSAPPPGAAELQEMLDSPSTTVWIARVDSIIVGTLTLIVVRIPTGVRARIEDVVVDSAARGCGAGEALTRAALAKARGLGTRTVDLSTRPSREAANRLYQRLGFERRETNVYRYPVG